MPKQLTIHLAGAQETNAPWGVELRIIKALKALGHKVISTDFRKNRPRLRELFAQPADLLVVCRGEGIPPEAVRAAPCPTALWYAEMLGTAKHEDKAARVRRAELAQNCAAFDYVFVHDAASLEVCQGLGVRRPMALPCAAVDPELNCRLELPKLYDVSFVGSATGRRQAFLEAIGQRFRVHNPSLWDPAELNRLYNQSRLVLNLHLSDLPNTETRVAEVLGAGAFLLSEELSMPRLFKDGQHLAMFAAGSVEDCLAKIGHYLEHESEREAIARCGHDYVHAEHTFARRMSQLLAAVDLDLKKPVWPSTALGVLNGPDGKPTARLADFFAATDQALDGLRGQGPGQKKPKLSLVMIAKDEERNLPRVLASAAPHVDEIVLVDTGSTDRTVEIAKQYGARVYHHQWEQDFAKHRNQALEYATGEWCLQLDADEELDAASAPKLRELISQGRYAAFTVQMVDVHQDGSRGLANLIRLFKNQPGVRYTRRVHNQIEIPGPVAQGPVRVYHYGYDLDPDTMTAKHRRRLDMIRAWVDEQPHDWEGHFYLAKALLEKPLDPANLPHAAQAARTALRLAQGRPEQALLNIYPPLVTALHGLGKEDEFLAQVDAWHRLAPDNPDPIHCLVMHHFQKGHWRECQRAAGEFLKLHQNLAAYQSRHPQVQVFSAGARQNVEAMAKQAEDRLAASAGQPGLSLVMIAKDEERDLPRALASAAPHVDEMVLVDTGSKDRTIEIARDHGVRVFEHVWEHDFAKHRNQALSYARGDWCLQLDADEELDPHTAGQIRELIQDARADAFYVEVVSPLPNGGQSRFLWPRLFRRQSGVRYVRPVHNKLEIPGAIKPSGLRIMHHGYAGDAQAMAGKHRRRVAMLERWAAQEPENWEAWFYLAKALGEAEAQAEETARAVEAAQRALELAPSGELAQNAYPPLLAALGRLGRNREFGEHLGRWLAISGQNPDPHHFQTVFAYRNQDFAQTAASARRYLECSAKADRYQAEHPSVQLVSFGREAEAHIMLLVASAKLGQDDQSRAIFEQMIEYEQSGDLARLAWQETAKQELAELAGQLAAMAARKRPDWDWPGQGSDFPRLLAQAQRLSAEHDFPAAGKMLQQALEINPESTEALCEMGYVLAKQGGAQLAQTFYQKALNLNPKLAGAAYNLARIRLALGETGQALDALAQCQKADPGFAPAKDLMARIKGRQEDRLADSRIH